MTSNNLQPESDTTVLDILTVVSLVLATVSALLTIAIPPFAVVALILVAFAVTFALSSWRRGRANNSDRNQQ